MEILHGLSLRVGHKQSLCLIGPNGAGKSTVLHSIFGFTNIYSGTIATERDGKRLDVTGSRRTRSCAPAASPTSCRTSRCFPA